MPRPPLLPAVAATVAGLVLLLTGCGGDDAQRPGAPEMRRSLRDADLSAEAADCATDVLLGSDISDRGLRSIVEADIENRPLFAGIEGDDVEALRAVEDDFGGCAGAELLEQQQATSTTAAPEPTSTTAAG